MNAPTPRRVPTQTYMELALEAKRIAKRQKKALHRMAHWGHYQGRVGQKQATLARRRAKNKVAKASRKANR